MRTEPELERSEAESRTGRRAPAEAGAGIRARAGTEMRAEAPDSGTGMQAGGTEQTAAAQQEAALPAPPAWWRAEMRGRIRWILTELEKLEDADGLSVGQMEALQEWDLLRGALIRLTDPNPASHMAVWRHRQEMEALCSGIEEAWQEAGLE